MDNHNVTAAFIRGKRPPIPDRTFDLNTVDVPNVQRACRAVLRLLMDDAGDEEARRTILLIWIAAIGG